jgi:hypothetical protein
MKAQEGHEWHTIEHESHAEYQSLLKDLVLESTYLDVERAAAVGTTARDLEPFAPVTDSGSRIPPQTHT